MSKIDDALRNEWTQKVFDFFQNGGEEVMHEKDNILWIPTVNADGEDKWIKVMIQVPTKVTGDGDDGYELNEAWLQHKAEQAAKAKEAAAKKAKKMAEDAAKRAAKAQAKANSAANV